MTPEIKIQVGDAALCAIVLRVLRKDHQGKPALDTTIPWRARPLAGHRPILSSPSRPERWRKGPAVVVFRSRLCSILGPRSPCLRRSDPVRLQLLARPGLRNGRPRFRRLRSIPVDDHRRVDRSLDSTRHRRNRRHRVEGARRLFDGSWDQQAVGSQSTVFPHESCSQTNRPTASSAPEQVVTTVSMCRFRQLCFTTTSTAVSGPAQSSNWRRFVDATGLSKQTSTWLNPGEHARPGETRR